MMKPACDNSESELRWMETYDHFQQEDLAKLIHGTVCGVLVASFLWERALDA